MLRESKVIPFSKHLKTKRQAFQTIELLRHAVDTMSNYFLMWDPEDRLVVCNEKMFELYPDSRDIFVVGRTFEDVLYMGFERGDFETPEDMTAEEWIQYRLALHRKGDYIEVRKIKGRWLQVRDQMTVGGFIVSTAVDVTPLKEKEKELTVAKERAVQAENLLRDALDTMSNAFLLWDKEDKLILCNKRVFEIHPNSRDIYRLGRTYEEIVQIGLEKGEFDTLEGITKEERLEQKQRVVFYKGGERANDGQGSRWLQVREHRTPRGHIVTTAVDVSPLKEKEHQLELAKEQAEIAHKKTKQALKQARKAWKEAELARAQAEKATQAKSQFLAMMSHEIRTPLQGIINMGQLLMASIVHPTQHDKLMTILRSSEALLTILNDALDIAKVEAGKLTLTHTSFDLKKLVEGVMVMYTLPVQERNLQFSYYIDPRLPRYLKGDAPKIRQILFNFIDNALKFTSKGKIVVRCERRPSSYLGCVKLYLAVTDTGMGINREVQQKLFTEFTQADETIAHQFGGFGLGLSICKKMIDSLEGEIGVESKSRKGSTFWVMIDGLESTDRFDSFNWYYGNENHTNLPSQRILLVEDNILNQKSTREVLQYLGHKVTVVPDGIEALRELKKRTFDLIITDLQMPRLDGYNLIRNIRSLPTSKKSVPIIALTAQASVDDEAASLKAGVTKHLAKPVTMWSLQKAMAEVLNYHCVTDQEKKAGARNAYYQEKDQPDDFQLVSVDQAALQSLSSVLPHDNMVNVMVDYRQAVTETFKQHLAAALKKKDYANMHNMVNNFRCLSGTLGLRRLVVRLENLEAAIKNKDQERIYDYYNQADQELDSVLPILEGLYKDREQGTSEYKESDLLVSPNTNKTPFYNIKTVCCFSQDQTLNHRMQKRLSNYGYKVNKATTLKRLQAMLPQNKPFLLMVDLDHMSNKDDVTHFCQALKEQQNSPYYLMASSDQDTLKMRCRAVQLGAYDFYSKPIDYSALVDKLDQLTFAKAPEPIRVLLIDEDPFMGKLYSEMLQKSGMVTQVMHNPTAIIPVLHDFQPDIILMDFNIPECNGLEVSWIIRQHPTFVGIPIIFLSGERDYAKHVAAMRWGGDEFLTKPIDAPRLIEAVTLRVERLRKLRSFMIQDSLTGLLNHGTIQNNLATQILQAERQQTPLSFVLMDVDKFKEVNDTYGHPVGDFVIKALSRYLKRHLRRTDIIGRYGGEEFAIILPNTTGQETKKVIDKIRRGFANLKHTTDDQQIINVSFSAGIADYPTIKSWSDLIRVADKKLYEAKHKGRNRTVLYKMEKGSKD